MENKIKSAVFQRLDNRSENENISMIIILDHIDKTVPGTKELDRVEFRTLVKKCIQEYKDTGNKETVEEVKPKTVSSKSQNELSSLSRDKLLGLKACVTLKEIKTSLEEFGIVRIEGNSISKIKKDEMFSLIAKALSDSSSKTSPKKKKAEEPIISKEPIVEEKKKKKIEEPEVKTEESVVEKEPIVEKESIVEPVAEEKPKKKKKKEETKVEEPVVEKETIVEEKPKKKKKKEESKVEEPVIEKEPVVETVVEEKPKKKKKKDEPVAEESVVETETVVEEKPKKKKKKEETKVEEPVIEKEPVTEEKPKKKKKEGISISTVTEELKDELKNSSFILTKDNIICPDDTCDIKPLSDVSKIKKKIKSLQG